MTTADDGVGGSNFVWEVVARFSLFYKQSGAFVFAKSKAINFGFKDYFDRYIMQPPETYTAENHASSEFK